MQQLFPLHLPVAEPLAIYDEIVFPEPPPGRAYLYINMVASVDGRAQLEGSAQGIGSRVDLGLLWRLRARADCVLHGAETVRRDRFSRLVPPELVERRLARGQPAQPLWAVATASGQVPLVAPDPAQGGRRPIVFVAARTPAERRRALAEQADVVEAGERQPDPAEMLWLLRERYGARHVLCEGGPRLNHAFLRAGVVDELFLTLAPTLLAGDGLAIVAGPLFPPELRPRLELISLFEHQDELFLRYQVRPPPAPAAPPGGG